jgi:hypothetical protein
VSKKCKSKGQKGICCYQDSKDRATTSNLKNHAIKCFGHDAIDAAFENRHSAGRDGSMFAAFARQDQQPVKVSHCAHTSEESRCVSFVFFFQLLMK